MRNILFCGNSKVFDGVLTCMLSVLKRTHATDPFCFYIFTMDMTRIRPEYTPISEDMTDFLERVAKKFHPQNRVISVDVTVLYERYFGGCPNESAYCSPYTLLRLLADLVPGLKRLFGGGRFRLDMVVEHMRRLVEERLQQTAYDFVVIEMVDACDFPFEKMIVLQQFDGFPVGEVNLEIAAHIEHLVP